MPTVSSFLKAGNADKLCALSGGLHPWPVKNPLLEQSPLLSSGSVSLRGTENRQKILFPGDRSASLNKEAR